MGNLQLSLALDATARVRPLIDGSVRPEGIEPLISTLHPSEIFWRQVKSEDFDVSEMSLATLIMLTSRGPTSWVALPIFPYRSFFHTGILVHVDAGITCPQDLRGKRIGLPEYQISAALWIRGILEDEFGVRPADIEWFVERKPQMSIGGASAFQPPPGVRIRHVPPDTTTAALLRARALDGVAFYNPNPTLLDRSGFRPGEDSHLRLLFADPVAEAARLYTQTGLYPMNHCVVVRRSIYERHPWVALNLYHAFLQAKNQAVAESKAWLDTYMRLGLCTAAEGYASADPFPYGIKANRHTLLTMTRYAHHQGLAARQVDINELFAETTLDT